MSNPEKRNAVGGRIGYPLVPHATAAPLFLPGSQQHDRGGCATRYLWATAFDPAQRYAAGETWRSIPAAPDCPPTCAATAASTAPTLVLWHTLAAHHVVRTEDWPVMPVSTVGMRLEPNGFFDGNPVLDLPREGSHVCEPALRRG